MLSLFICGLIAALFPTYLDALFPNISNYSDIKLTITIGIFLIRKINNLGQLSAKAPEIKSSISWYYGFCKLTNDAIIQRIQLRDIC